jgi:hypothetical protein
MSADLDQRHPGDSGRDASGVPARGPRRDLVWINALMLQSRIMAGLLNRHIDASQANS